MKKLYTLTVLLIMIVAFQSSVNKGQFSSVPPQGYTGATGNYCVSCHSSFGLNSGGGSVMATGLPSGNYVAGQAYNFSITINHGAANRTRWGFSIRAVNSAGQNVGTFSSTNANASPNGNELSHNGAVSTGAQASFTYTNLRWTAPVSPSANDRNVTFYYVGNAANGNGSNSGDYIYSNISSTVLPIELSQFTATTDNKTVTLKWQTEAESNSNYFEVEKSDDAQIYYAIGKLTAAGNSNSSRKYSFTDDKPSFFEKPIFYRLKLTDKDGSYKYSAVVNVKLKASKTFITKLYPSIISQSPTVINTEVVSDKKQTIMLQLVDLMGRQVQAYKLNVEAGINQLTFMPSANLAKGMLFAKFSGDGLQQTISITVQ